VEREGDVEARKSFVFDQVRSPLPNAFLSSAAKIPFKVGNFLFEIYLVIVELPNTHSFYLVLLG